METQETSLVKVQEPTEGKSLRESLLKLSTSPVKTDRTAIARLEREVGKPVSQIIADLENAQIMIDAVPKKSELGSKASRAILTGIFIGAIMGTVAMFVQPLQIYVAFALGIAIGTSGSLLFGKGQSKLPQHTDFKL
jgi:hypothetical protein